MSNETNESFADAPTFAIGKIDVKPGDIVVIKGLRFKHAEDQASFHKHIQDAFPGLQFMILPPGVDVAAISKQDIKETDKEPEPCPPDSKQIRYL